MGEIYGALQTGGWLQVKRRLADLIDPAETVYNMALKKLTIRRHKHVTCFKFFRTTANPKFRNLSQQFVEVSALLLIKTSSNAKSLQNTLKNLNDVRKALKAAINNENAANDENPTSSKKQNLL